MIKEREKVDVDKMYMRTKYIPTFIEKHLTPRLTEVLKIANTSPLLKQYKEPKSFFIHGGLGTGKTVFGAQLFIQYYEYVLRNRLVSRYRGEVEAYVKEDFKFVTFPEMFKLIQDSFHTNKKILNELLNCDYLFIDDFLTTKLSDWSYGILYHVLNHRYEYLKTTIITSNLNLTDVSKTLGDQRIERRIAETYEIMKKTPWDKTTTKKAK